MSSDTIVNGVRFLVRHFVVAVVISLAVQACSGGGIGTTETPIAETTSTTADAETTTTVEALPTVTGRVVLEPGTFIGGVSDPTCWGRDHFEDIGHFTDVTVRNGEGDIIGLGKLDVGKHFKNVVTDEVLGCALTFEVDLSDSASFYTFEIAERSGRSFSHEELAEGDWEVELRFG